MEIKPVWSNSSHQIKSEEDLEIVLNLCKTNIIQTIKEIITNIENGKYERYKN